MLEGLLYVGTDDGNLNITEDGGKTWRKTTQFATAPDGFYVSDVFASLRDANVVFITLNNWQRGDYKPYIFRSDDRGRTFQSIVGNFPDRQPVWSIIQDHVNGDLIFAGTEWGVFFTVDGGAHWTQLKGGIPTIQVRDMTVQKREHDLVLGTFGRGFYVLDDYSPLRGLTAAGARAGGRAVPAAARVSVRRAHAAERRLGQRGDAEPAVRRAAHVSRRDRLHRRSRARRE